MRPPEPGDPATSASGEPLAGAEPTPGSAPSPLPPAWQRLRPGPPWRIWEAFALLALFFAAQLVFSGLAAALSRRFFPPGEGTDELTQMVRYSLPAGLLASYALSAAAIWWLLVRRRRLSMARALGLGPYPAARLVAPFSGGIALQFFSALLVAVTPPPEDKEFLFDLFLRGGGWSIAFFFVVAVGMAPVLEEMLFRGLLLPALMRNLDFFRSALLVTVLFTALHAFQTGLYWPALTSIFLCGWMLAWLRERHGVLWPSIAFHIGFNLTAFLPVLLFGQHLE